jgi:hypothetical protein
MKFRPAVLELHADKWKDGRTDSHCEIDRRNFLQNFTANG